MLHPSNHRCLPNYLFDWTRCAAFIKHRRGDERISAAWQSDKERGSFTVNTFTLHPYAALHSFRKLAAKIQAKPGASLHAVDRLCQTHKLAKKARLDFQADTGTPITDRYYNELTRNRHRYLLVDRRSTQVQLIPAYD